MIEKIENTVAAGKDWNKEQTSVLYTRRIVHFIQDVYLTNHFSDARYMLDILQMLRTTTENDSVNFYLNNYGGDCASGTQLINAVKQCKAKDIVVYVDAGIYSMASVFAVAVVKMAGAGIVLGDDVMFMFHNYSGGTHGKGHELEAAIKADKVLFEQSDINRLFPFMSTQELTDMRHGKDFYFHNEELIVRFKNLTDYMQGLDYKDGDILIKVKKKGKK